MLKRWGLGLCLAGAVTSSVGCRCLPGLNAYGNVIDDVSDADWWHPLDNVYCPRLDISRAGRPDWCGPVNSRLCPCRCVNGTWDRYDECNLYPPAYPYQYPGSFFGTVVNPATGTPYPQPAPLADPLRNESDEVEREMLPDSPQLDLPRQPLPPAPEPSTRRPVIPEESSGVIPASAQVLAPHPTRRVAQKPNSTTPVPAPKPTQSLLP